MAGVLGRIKLVNQEKMARADGKQKRKDNGEGRTASALSSLTYLRQRRWFYPLPFPS